MQFLIGQFNRQEREARHEVTGVDITFHWGGRERADGKISGWSRIHARNPGPTLHVPSWGLNADHGGNSGDVRSQFRNVDFEFKLRKSVL